MEMELEPGVKHLGFKVKATSRESPPQKAAHILDADLRTHWSTGTSTKEWILLELDEPCLLSHIRIYNKSVLEWEIAVGLRYKPETFAKVRSRCDAPRRDMVYPMNYTPCRYVRISCLRGNPIAIFFVQLIGVSVPGLDPEFQPVANHLLPHIISHKQDNNNIYLQLLQDLTSRLLIFLPQLEADLSGFPDAAESSLRFLAMLIGPFYPILKIVSERESTRSSANVSDSEASKNIHSLSAVTVSSNFEVSYSQFNVGQPRRSRGTSSSTLNLSCAIAFRLDAIFLLLRKACEDSDLRIVCKTASRILQKLVGPSLQEGSTTIKDDLVDETLKFELLSRDMTDYSSLFGEEFQIPDYPWDCSILNILDIGAVEEGILHFLFACATQPVFCSKLSENPSDLWFGLPLVQALLPVLRPCGTGPSDIIDFSPWEQVPVQQALSQIVLTASSPLYHPLLQACAGYLSSFSQSHARAACVLIDLCSGVLAPWMAQVTAKVDLAIELLEDLLGTIQEFHQAPESAQAALKYVVLALSGHMDDILWKYKEAKHKILFLLEMLKPFLNPAMYPLKSTIAFGDVSTTFTKQQEQSCVIALNVIRTAVGKPVVLPSLESEWRRGSVVPSVLLLVLEPQMQLPPEIDLCKSPSKKIEDESSNVSNLSLGNGGSLKSHRQADSEVKADLSDVMTKMDVHEEARLFFAPPELQRSSLTYICGSLNENILESLEEDIKTEHNVVDDKMADKFQNGLVLDPGFAAKYFSLQVDYFQLFNLRDCELRASEFRRLALDLCSHDEITIESHDAAIDALLLAAECYVNPFFVKSFGASSNIMKEMEASRNKTFEGNAFSGSRRFSKKDSRDLETVAHLEDQRDKIVLQILLEAAELDRKGRSELSTLDDQRHLEVFEYQVIELSSTDMRSADAVTLVRQNQELLCSFLIQRLKIQQNSLHEILLQCLTFFFCSATKLYCAPDDVIDIIIRSAEDLNKMLTSLHYQLKEGNQHLDQAEVLQIQRRWLLLQRLVMASSGRDIESDFGVNVNNGSQYESLIPPLAWIEKISVFSDSSFPLARFLGWMAVARISKQFKKDQLYLVSDLSQLTCLLSIYADELVLGDNFIDKKRGNIRGERSGVEEKSLAVDRSKTDNYWHGNQSLQVIYPYLGVFFPKMKKQFDEFGEAILEAVSLQLRLLSSSVLPDILCWFSDLCSWPIPKGSQLCRAGSDCLKGYVAKNAKAIILYVLEAIVTEHMEAMVPEVPRVMQVLISLSRSDYCDVSFLNSVLLLLKPIISYSLHKCPAEEKLLVSDSCLDFESICFEELFADVRQRVDSANTEAKDGRSRALTTFILASVFPDLSSQHRRSVLQSWMLWADFTTSEPTTFFHDYLSAFQAIIESCKVLLVETLKALGLLPVQLSFSSPGAVSEDSPKSETWFLNDIFCGPPDYHGTQETSRIVANSSKTKNTISAEEIEGFTKDLEGVVAKLYPTIERCWTLHPQLAKKLTIVSAECAVYSKCLVSFMPVPQNAEIDESFNCSSFRSDDQVLSQWKKGLKGLAETILELQENHCWEVASAVLGCLLDVSPCLILDSIDSICSAIRKNSYSAPKLAWRLLSDKWLSILTIRVFRDLKESQVFPLVDLFSVMLGHSEPEQRLLGLRHLGKLVGQDVDDAASSGSIVCTRPLGLNILAPDAALSLLVSSTWDLVVVLASADVSILIRSCAMGLLISYIPFAKRNQLQSFLQAADNVLYGFGKLFQPMCEGPLLRLSLALIVNVCIYCCAEDIALIPENVWKAIEALGSSKTDGRLGDVGRKACQVLCRLRNERDGAKEILKDVLSSTSAPQLDPNFAETRESILKVLSSLTSVQEYFDLFSRKLDQEDMELEEAEAEFEMIQMDHQLQEPSKDSEEQVPLVATFTKSDDRLQQIKDSIRSLEKAKLREDVVARRQKKLLLRQARQKHLEETALREAELLQVLDRGRTAESEKEIERQRLLELERAKTRELRHQLEMEREKQTQRELQRELEQVESGLRSSRRDFASSHSSSRPRERYRERENGRPNNEASTRTSSGTAQQEGSSAVVAPTIVLSGSRPFSGQPPTILQPRERLDECGSSYEENFEGSRDSGDAGSVGDPELVSAFDGHHAGYGSSQRHGSRGSKSRQGMERRDREGRREGKWERKH